MMTTILSSTTTLQKKDTLSRFFQANTVANVVHKLQLDGTIHDLPFQSTLGEALSLFTSRDIVSLPLYQVNPQQEKEYITIITILDLLRLLSTHLLSNDAESRNIALNIKLNETKIGTNKQLTVLRSTDSLKKLLETLVANQHVLVSMHGQFNLISQMDLIKFLQHNNHYLGSSILDIQVPALPKQQNLIPISYKSTAAQAFLKLAEHPEQNAFPIVDDNDEFIGEVNAQALNNLDELKWSTLLSPVMMFLKMQSPPFTCGNHFTLSQIMTAFVLRKAHRLWWIDMNDILSFILSQS
ncbi:hypothetical protein K501DRAFT_303052 [Backusella circina FSU 941]|nr:hypothetical protein K501DRAFT_303052 [Backusella circina FSU 941]